uniref:Secreted protein n=1 Tax=Parascaris univalens TaxID=6257 RepID=A0A915A421_PARUN
DAGPAKHDCDHNEIIAASNTVSDLLTHRKNSGSFLKSYYLLTYACSQIEVFFKQQIPVVMQMKIDVIGRPRHLKEHRECLTEERIGEMTLSAGTYLSEKFLEHPDEEVCEEVNKKLQEYIGAMKGICDSESAQMIMCKSLRNMFKGLHADKLHNCQFNCIVPQKGPEPEVEEEVTASAETADEQNVVPESHSLNSAPTFTYLITITSLVLALLTAS